MKFFAHYYKEVGVAALLFAVPFFIPHLGVTDNGGVLITAVSTLFAIVVGFFIADAMSNYLRLQTLIALENGTLIALAHAAREISATLHPTLHDAIDKYLIAQLNADSLNHILDTEEEMREIVRQTDVLIRGSQMDTRWESTHHMLKTIHVARQEIALVAKANLLTPHWAILAILSGLLMLTILSVRDGSLLLNIIGGLMMVGSYSVLILLREVDSNRLLEQKLSFENPIEVFSALDRPPFFPHFADPRVYRPGRDGTCRVGTKPGSVKPYTVVIL
ncbi:MAG: hypothetical protein NBV63_02395 [Candidatus Pacebacteria bacterium]|nr:hypothetical protein [Candidatus Paceibacterota bacterium]